MLARSEMVTPDSGPGTPTNVPLRPRGLLAARLGVPGLPLAGTTVVGELDATTVARVRAEALALRARHRAAVTIELRYVADPLASELLAPLGALGSEGVTITAVPLAPLTASAPPLAPEPASPAAAAATPLPSRTTVHAPQEARREDGTDPFGLDREYRALWIPPLRFLFERYWRVSVTGVENLPTAGPALVVANHSGAVPADAFMLAIACELHTARCLRVLYDKFVELLPWIGPIYNRLGGVAASFANAERLLRSGELVSLFPEGIAGVEKRFTERYRLRPFKTGTARLSLRTGSPIVPVAIVGAEEAYPVVARLYRTGRLVGLPWIPITPLFPLCGVVGALPLPTKWHMHFGAPITPPPPDGRPEEERVAALTARLRAAIDAGIDDLLAKRRGIFV